MILPFSLHLVHLAEAARLAGLDSETFLHLALMIAERPELDPLTIWHGLGGPRFDAWECRALGAILANRPKAEGVNHEAP